jgi:hypothetical protein
VDIHFVRTVFRQSKIVLFGVLVPSDYPVNRLAKELIESLHLFSGNDIFKQIIQESQAPIEEEKEQPGSFADSDLPDKCENCKVSLDGTIFCSECSVLLCSKCTEDVHRISIFKKHNLKPSRQRRRSCHFAMFIKKDQVLLRDRQYSDLLRNPREKVFLI